MHAYVVIESYGKVRNKPEAGVMAQRGKAYDAKPNSLNFGPQKPHGGRRKLESLRLSSDLHTLL